MILVSIHLTTKGATKMTIEDKDFKEGHTLALEYESYYNACEKANKFPLSFDKWLVEQNKGE